MTNKRISTVSLSFEHRKPTLNIKFIAEIEMQSNLSHVTDKVHAVMF